MGAKAISGSDKNATEISKGRVASAKKNASATSSPDPKLQTEYNEEDLPLSLRLGRASGPTSGRRASTGAMASSSTKKLSSPATFSGYHSLHLRIFCICFLYIPFLLI